MRVDYEITISSEIFWGDHSGYISILSISLLINHKQEKINYILIIY